MATYTYANLPSKLNPNDIINIDYSGAAQTINLPKGKFKLEVWGAQGGYRSSSARGGKGGYSVGTITLTSPTKIYAYAGGSGNTGGTSGGFNGGGSRSSYSGGGGGSDFRLRTNSLYSRVIVAGGGGSDGATGKTGMYGGGTSGGSTSESYGTGGGGGTQTAGGAGGSGVSNSGTFGQGGEGLYRSSGYAGAGGGGWYGGGGSYPDGSGDDDRGGGGGSGYVYTSSTASNYPSGCTLSSADYLESANTIAGNNSITEPNGSSSTGHSGNGYCRITVIEVQAGVPIYIGNKQTQAIYLGNKEVKHIYLGSKQIF